jgi:hypothetical protein
LTLLVYAVLFCLPMRGSQLRVYSHINADQRFTMTLAQMSQPISELLEAGGLWQLEGQGAGLEHGHYMILRLARDMKALHGISLLGFFDPCREARLRDRPRQWNPAPYS